MQPFKRHKVSSTELRYDNIYTPQDHGFQPEEFKSSRQNRYRFIQQEKSQFQDDEDVETEMEHIKILSNFVDLSEVMDLTLNEIETVVEQPNVVKEKKKPKRKVKVRLNYGEEEGMAAEKGQLDIQLKRVESKMKYQKPNNSKPKDSVFTSFVKDLELVIPPLIRTVPSSIPADFESKFPKKNLQQAPLNKLTASSLLQSKFTTSGALPPPLQHNTTSTPRKTIPIKVDPLIKKRLNI